jgi:hypothetical protein
MEPDRAPVTPAELQQLPDPATGATWHCGAGVPEGEGLAVSEAVKEGVGEGEKVAVVVRLGVDETVAPVDLLAERGVVVGERVAEGVAEGGGLNTTVAMAPPANVALPSVQ